MEKSNKIESARLKQDIDSCSMGKDDLRQLSMLLQSRADAALDYELRHFEQGSQTEDQYIENKKTLKDSFQLRFTVKGVSGQELYGSIHEVFDSINFPDRVKTFFVDSANILNTVHNYYPHNKFSILLDFSKPKIFDFSLMPSMPTPNVSNFEVYGQDITWVNGVFSELNKLIKDRQQANSFIHKHSIYDFILYVLGFPIAFWMCYKASGFVEGVFGNFSGFLKGALYFYIAIFTLNMVRVLFHYARWVYPKVEYQSKYNSNNKHKLVLAGITVSIFGTFLYDIIQHIF